MTPFDLDYIPPGHFGPAWSFVVGVVLLGLGVGGCILRMLLEARALGRAQDREPHDLRTAAEAPLHPGPRRVVHGVVEPVEGAGEVALEVEITQEAKDHKSKSRTWHTWDEVGRKVKASSFYLVRADGESVLVEPDERALVVDELETAPAPMRRQRLRKCDVRRGETFFAHGDLHRGHHARASRARGGYRGDGLGWILRVPGDGTRMLFATELIADRYAKRVSALRWWGALSLVAWLIFHSFTTLPFLASSLVGRHTTATVTRQRVTVTTQKRSRTHHYLVEVKADDTSNALWVEQEVPIATYQAIARPFEAGERVEVPLTVIGNSTWGVHLGRAASIGNIGLHIFMLVAAVVTGVVCWGAYERAHAWYDRKSVCEHGGEGHYVELPGNTE